MIIRALYTLLLSFAFQFYFPLYAQTFCPVVYARNSGDVQYSLACGDFTPLYAQNNPVATNVIGTKYQKINVNPATKTGDFSLKWDSNLASYVPVITRVWLTDLSGVTTLSSIVFGPPSPISSGSDLTTYAYYGSSLPSSGKITFEFTNPTTGLVTLVCSKDLKTNNSVTNPILKSYAPTIVNQPINQSYLGDGVALFTATAINATSYQWQYSRYGNSWNNIVANSDYSISANQLFISNRSKYKNYSYRVIYTNYYGSVTSNTTVLSIDELPTVSFSSLVNCDVSSLSSTNVTFTGLTPWNFSYSINGGDPINIVGINSTTYSLPIHLSETSVLKLLSVTDSKYTNTGLVTNTVFTTYQKGNLVKSVIYGSEYDTVVEVSVSNNTYNALSIYKAIPSLTDFVNKTNTPLLNGKALIKLPADPISGNFNFNVILSNLTTGCKSDTLNLNLTLKSEKLAIIQQPVSQNYVENGVAVFNLVSENATSFQWQYSFNNGITWNDISKGGNFLKVTKDSLVIDNRLYYKNNVFRVVLYGLKSTVVSSEATLTIDRKPIAFFESYTKCQSNSDRSVLVYLKGTSPYSFTYSIDNQLPIVVSNITKDVYLLNLSAAAKDVKIISMSDSRFTNVLQDSNSRVRFYMKPIVSASLSLVCFKDSVSTLTINGQSNKYSLTAGSIIAPGFSPISDAFIQTKNVLSIPKNLLPGTYDFILTVKDANCDSDPANVSLIVKPLPLITASASSYSIVTGDSIVLSASGAGNYIWTPSSALSSNNTATVVAKPTKTTLYTLVGSYDGCFNSDTVKVFVNASSTSAQYSPLLLTVNPNDIVKSTCTTIADGQITFSVANGSENNKYRIRKKNLDGTFTVITYPTFASLNNLLNESKTVTVSNLLKGSYDLFVFCGADTKITKVYNFTIASNCDTIPLVDTTLNIGNENYTCDDMVLTLNNSDISPVSCENSADGKIVFTISGGAPNFTYRLRKRKADNSFTIISNPVFVSIGNAAKEIKRVTIDALEEGEYELYVYCSQDVSFNKSVGFFISKNNCKTSLKNVISYYSFDKNSNDSIKRASSPIVDGAVNVDDNYGNVDGSYRIYGNQDYLKFASFIDIDTLNEYTISFWYKLLTMPTSTNNTILTVPNGTSSKRLEIVADKNGDLKVQFGGGTNSILNNTKFKVELGIWNQIVLTHDQDSDKIYVNSKIIGTYHAAQFTNNNTDFIVGYNGINKAAKFNFDEFKLYDKAISYNDISENYFTDVRENCSSIRLNVQVIGTTISFNVSYGSSNNKYRLRKKNTSGDFVTITNSAFVSLLNKVGENKEINLSGLTPGIYDIYAYCGADSKKYQGYEFIIDSRGNASIYKKITPTEVIIVEEDGKEEIYVNVYPNPVDNVVNIDVIGSENNVEKTIRLISANGVIVHDETFNSSDANISINVEHLRAGVYFLEIQMPDNRVERKQIVIN